MVPLAGYCESYARWQQCEAVLRAEGLTYNAPGGQIIQRPEVAIGNKALENVKRLGAAFGLSPADRGRLVVPKVPDDDTLGGLLT
jgi:P27 family predicted phage terminase small subunit